VFKDHHAELASTLIHIFCHYDRVVPILTACLKKSIDKEGKTKTPGSPPFTKLKVKQKIDVLRSGVSLTCFRREAACHATNGPPYMRSPLTTYICMLL
jgi:hypothetical protein